MDHFTWLWLTFPSMLISKLLGCNKLLQQYVVVADLVGSRQGTGSLKHP